MTCGEHELVSYYLFILSILCSFHLHTVIDCTVFNIWFKFALALTNYLLWSHIWFTDSVKRHQAALFKNPAPFPIFSGKHCSAMCMLNKWEPPQQGFRNIWIAYEELIGSGDDGETADYQTAHLHPEPFPVHNDEGFQSHFSRPQPLQSQSETRGLFN